jgi:hypothetical protein
MVDTETPPTPPVVADGAGNPPDTAPDPVPGPLPRSSWLRRLAIVAALAVAVGVLWYGGRRADDGVVRPGDAVVVLQDPAPGTRAVRQTTVGAELEPGYDGRLTINGVAIPEEQMEGAIDPRTVSPDQLERYGVRPNNRNRVFFRPGKGKVLEELPRGDVTVTVRYFRERHDPAEARLLTWSFHVD